MQIRKKMWAVILLVLILAVSIVVLAACNKGNENQNNSSNDNLPNGISIVKGDNIFTEDVTLEQLAYALRNADSLTINLSSSRFDSYEEGYDILYCYDRKNQVLVSRNLEIDGRFVDAPIGAELYQFVDNAMFYTICFVNYKVVTQDDGSDKFELNPDGKFLYDYTEKSDNDFEELEDVEKELEEILSYFVMQDGKLVLDEQGIWMGNATNCRLELKGSEMTISFTVVDDSGENTDSHMYFTIKGVNATDIVISEEIKAYKDQTET